MRPGAPIRRAARLPDPLRVQRSLGAPELGPRILFFSGGSALRETSRVLKHYTHNSTHLITPFDSGGSSARLREAFGMLSVGDLRNRLMALADDTLRGNPEIYDLFAQRMPRDASSEELAERLVQMQRGRDEAVAAVPQPLQRIVRTHLRLFAEHMPLDFDLRGASVGNLVLAGGYLNNDRDIESVIYLFSKLVEVRGLVHPIANTDLQLSADLEDGSRIVGQHRMTGKVVPPITSPVANLELVRSLDDPTHARVEADARACSRILDADVIVYPMGSFYTSILANLLPLGVGRSVRAAECPKVYVPNLGRDPEQLGMGISHSVEAILRFVRKDAGADAHASDILNLVLVDLRNGDYGDTSDLVRLKDMGVELVDLELVTDASRPWIDPGRLTEALISLT